MKKVILSIIFCSSILLNFALAHDLSNGRDRQLRYSQALYKADKKIEHLKYKLSFSSVACN